MMWMCERAAAARLTSSIVWSSSVHALCRRLTRTAATSILGQLFVMPRVQQQQQQQQQQTMPGRHSSLVISAAHRLSETIHAHPRRRSDPRKHGGQRATATVGSKSAAHHAMLYWGFDPDAHKLSIRVQSQPSLLLMRCHHLDREAPTHQHPAARAPR
jgi:hypothetical protein